MALSKMPSTPPKEHLCEEGKFVSLILSQRGRKKRDTDLKIRIILISAQIISQIQTEILSTDDLLTPKKKYFSFIDSC